jgi:subtilisin family serine protease
LELTVEDKTAQVETGRSQTTANANPCSAVVRFKPQAGHRYQTRVHHLQGDPGRFHLVVLGGGLEFGNRNGSIPFPGDGPEVIAVGAVDRLGKRLAYSSCGLAPDLLKPDLAASVPFPSQWRSRPFTGTSAAAPQAAALAALLWSRHPAWSAQQVRDALRASARPVGATNPNCETGYGSLHLP